MIRDVPDTNLLVSYLLTHRPPIAALTDRHLAREDFVMVTAPDLLEELERVLRYPRLYRYYTDSERTRFVALLMTLSEVVELPESIPRICRDPGNDRVIACAVSGKADVIVSGNRDLLALERVGRISLQSLRRSSWRYWIRVCEGSLHSCDASLRARPLAHGLPSEHNTRSERKVT